MSNTLSADVVATGAKHGATTHAELTWNVLARRARFRAVCHTPTPSATQAGLISELQKLVREGGFPDQRVTFEGPNRLRIDAR